jgi:hypothetical protein
MLTGEARREHKKVFRNRVLLRNIRAARRAISNSSDSL